MKRGYMGHEKEPPSAHGKKSGGKHPPMHSHSAKPKRKMMVKK